MKIFTIVLIMSLTGCSLYNKSPAPIEGGKLTPSQTIGVTQVQTDAAITKVSDAQAKLDSENATLLSKVKANVTTARVSNSSNPDGIPKVKVENALAVAESRLDRVIPDPVELAEQRARDLLIEQGKVSEAREATNRAILEGKNQAIQIGLIQAELLQATKERDEARARELASIEVYKAQMTKNGQEFDKRVKELNDAAAAKQVKILTWVGIGCALLFALGTGFGGIAGAKLTWPVAVFGVICLGLGQLVATAWFKYVVLGSIILICLIGAYWLYQQYKVSQLKEEAELKTTQLKSVTNQIIPMLDKAYDDGDQAIKDTLDKHVFDPLAIKMDRSEKAAIHEIRSQQVPSA